MASFGWIPNWMWMWIGMVQIILGITSKPAVLCGCYCFEQWQPPGTGGSGRSTAGWVLKWPLTHIFVGSAWKYRNSLLHYTKSALTGDDVQGHSAVSIQTRSMNMKHCSTSCSELSIVPLKYLRINIYIVSLSRICVELDKTTFSKHIGSYSQRDLKSILTKHDFNDFKVGDKIDT